MYSRELLLTSLLPETLSKFWSPSILAQVSSGSSSSTLEWDTPFTLMDWVPIVLLLVAVASTLWFGFQNRRHLSPAVSLFLVTLRLSFLALALVIALNPHDRTQTEAYRDSRVIMLVDTSQSMLQPQGERNEAGTLPGSRADAAKELLGQSELLNELRRDHSVDLYTFDSSLSAPVLRLASRFKTHDSPAEGSQGAEQNAGALAVGQGTDQTPDQASGQVSGQALGGAPTQADSGSLNWDELLKFEGLSTRLGETLDSLLVETKSPTLSGVVILSDGASNGGRDIQVPRDRAQQLGVRLVTVGFGSTVPPLNLEVVRIVSPTDVQKGDPFELSAQLSSFGLAGRRVIVELLQQSPTDSEAILVASQDLVMGAEGQVAEVTFDLKPEGDGAFEYTVRARLSDGIETREDDNQLSRSINIYDRPLRVLIIAGGPQRDYRYARSILYRHPSMVSDIWLQTGAAGVVQESNKLLYRFPETVQELYEYDVLLAFDPDWTLLTLEQQKMLSNWVANEGGGMVLVAGDVNTSTLAVSPELEEIRKLYPVVLEEVALRLNSREAALTAFPFAFTPEGGTAEFLRLSDNASEDPWQDFPGVYATYPTRGGKAGTTVYAEFSDPLSRGRGGQPIALAGQRFGQGQVLYLGSPELWRLRALKTEFLDRLWTKLVRKSAEGRSKRGLQRGMFLLDGREFVLGQTIPLRLRALNPQFEPLVANHISLNVFGPGGVVISPGPELEKDPSRPAEFVGDFRALKAGRYRLQYQLPDSGEEVATEIELQLPRQESASLVQDESTLKRLVEGTQGEYVELAQAASLIPNLLPNKGESVIIDQRVNEIWDRSWMLGLLVGLICLEWLTRKLLKLA